MPIELKSSEIISMIPPWNLTIPIHKFQVVNCILWFDNENSLQNPNEPLWNKNPWTHLTIWPTPYVY